MTVMRIDDSHQPFKRTTKIGPGPKKRPTIRQSKEYTCSARKPTSSHYVQVCSYTGADGKKHQVTVKTRKGRKKKYNKVYRAWAKTHRSSLQARPRLRGYRCRRTKATSCR